MFIVSSTGTGKTMIGELCGIENILRKKGKMLFIVPLVALANQKYDQFTSKYDSLGITTSLKIGHEYMNKYNNNINKSLNSDIIIGTYEGIDYILRSGKSNLLGNVKTIVVDEIHILTDEERGHRLDGLISRLHHIFPKSQYIYLSATIYNSSYFSKKLDSTLVSYSIRPVPIERHLIFVEEKNKVKTIINLINNESKKISTKGYSGQSIIFTNSRKNCDRIVSLLPIKAAAYHAGLYNNDRKKIEKKFISGELNVIVTTAALGAGVDFPASQVIFESLAMGLNWITMKDFLQMSGRAGRPDYHDLGTVVLLPVPGKCYSSVQKETEDEIALSLLSGNLDYEKIQYTEEIQIEEVLASVSVTDSIKDLKKINESCFGKIDTTFCLSYLLKKKYIFINGDKVIQTNIGKIISKYFLSISQIDKILFYINENIDIFDIIIKVNFYNKLYLKIADQISKEINIKINSKISHGSYVDILFDPYYFTKISKKYQQMLINFSTDFMTCNCKNSPYCNCIEEKISKKIIDLKIIGYSFKEIISELEDKYGITTYYGDLISYFENIIRTIESIEKICKYMNKIDDKNILKYVIQKIIC